MNRLSNFEGMAMLRLASLAFTGALLAACGGGGGSPGATVNGTANSSSPLTVATVRAVLSLTVVNGVANEVKIFSTSNPAILSVKFTDSTGAPVSGANVNFTPNLPVYVQFMPSSGSGITDRDGVFTIRVLPGNTVSTGPVSVTADVLFEGNTVSSNVALLYVTQG